MANNIAPLLTYRTPLTATGAEVRGWFAGLPAMRPLPSESYKAWFEDFRLVTNDPRRRATFEREDLGLPDFRLQGVLQKHLAGQVAFSRAVSFATMKP